MWKKLKLVSELFLLLNCYYLPGIYLGRNGWEGSLSEFCLLFNSLKDSTVGSLKNTVSKCKQNILLFILRKGIAL